MKSAVFVTRRRPTLLAEIDAYPPKEAAEEHLGAGLEVDRIKNLLRLTLWGYGSEASWANFLMGLRSPDHPRLIVDLDKRGALKLHSALTKYLETLNGEKETSAAED